MNSAHLHRRNFLLHLQERQEHDRPVLLKEPAYERPTTAHIMQLHNEYAITRCLVDVPGVRPAYADDKGYIKRYIWYLRQKIEPDPANPQYILTERGFGYRFVA
jgi:hypothetical protein